MLALQIKLFSLVLRRSTLKIILLAQCARFCTINLTPTISKFLHYASVELQQVSPIISQYSTPYIFLPVLNGVTLIIFHMQLFLLDCSSVISVYSILPSMSSCRTNTPDIEGNVTTVTSIYDVSFALINIAFNWSAL